MFADLQKRGLGTLFSFELGRNKVESAFCQTNPDNNGKFPVVIPYRNYLFGTGVSNE